MSTLYVKWTPEIQAQFNKLSEIAGEHKIAARRLDMNERDFYDFRHGLRRIGRSRRTQESAIIPRKFVVLSTIEKLAAALDDPDIEAVEALTQAEWKARGEWLNPSKT